MQITDIDVVAYPEFTVKMDGLTIQVNKSGGGTVGREYKGEVWEFAIFDDNSGMPAMICESLYIGTAANHLKAAVIAFDFFNEQDKEEC